MHQMPTRRSYRQLVKKKCLEPDAAINRTVPVYDLSNEKLTAAQLPQVLKHVADNHRKHHKQQQIMSLDLSRNYLAQNSICLIARTDWSLLFGLYLQRCRLGSKICKYLAKNDWPNLRQLSLAENKIRDEGCRFIAKANMPKLNYLSLRSNDIQTAGCRALSQSNFPMDLRLYLASNEIERQGYRYFNGKFQKVHCDFRYCTSSDSEE